MKKEIIARNSSWTLVQQIAAALTGKPSPTWEMLLASVAKFSTVEQLQTVATGGVDMALLGQMVQQAVDGLDLSGVDEATVNSLIADALGGLVLPDAGIDEAAVRAIVDAAISELGEPLAQQILDQFGGGVADLTAYVVGVDDNLATTTTMAFSAQSGLQQFLTTVAGNPDPSLITVPNGGLAGLAGKAWEELVALVAGGTLTGGNPADLQALLDLLAVKPNATVADVEQVWQSLSDQAVSYMQLLSTLSGKPISDNPTIADVQQGFPLLVGMIVQQALENLPDVGGLTPEVQAALLATTASGLQLFFNGVTERLDGKDATAAQAANAILNIKSMAATADINVSTALDWAMACINAINGATGAGDAVTGVGPAMDAIRQTLIDVVGEAASLRDYLFNSGPSDPNNDDSIKFDELINAFIDEKLKDIGPVIMQAIESQNGRVLEKLTINTKAGGDGKVIIETNNLTGAQHKVGVDFVTQRDGEVSINGSRVLTTEDALEASGAGIDQAAIEAAVAAAAAPLIARIEALEAKTVAIEGDGTINAEYVIADIVGGAPSMSVNRLVQFLIDAIVWGADGVQGASDNSYNDVFERLKSLRTQSAWAVEETQRLETQDAEIVAYVVEQVAELSEFSQSIIDAMNGPNATIQSVTQMFWTLNDILVAVMEATGIDFPSKGASK